MAPKLPGAQPKKVRAPDVPTSPTTAGETGMKQLRSKWGSDLVAAGWVAFPSIILERQDALGLDALDVNIILHIAKHWFEPGNLPHPSKGSIAKAMQVTPRTVQKRISRLHDLGFLRRIERRGGKGTKGSQTSEYDLSGLVQQAFGPQYEGERTEQDPGSCGGSGSPGARSRRGDSEAPSRSRKNAKDVSAGPVGPGDSRWHLHE